MATGVGMSIPEVKTIKVSICMKIVTKNVEPVLSLKLKPELSFRIWKEFLIAQHGQMLQLRIIQFDFCHK